MSGASVAAAIAARKRREVISKFEAAQATSRERAQALTTLGIERSRVFGRLAARGVLVGLGDGRYFLDRARWSQVRRHRRMALAAVVLSVLIGAFAAWSVGWL